jgi:hypothetical protein
VALATLLGAVLVTGSATAEHEVYYRYTLLGYVKDGRGQPQPRREIAAIRDRTGFSYLAETDAKGFYVLVIRLGDESLGEQLTIRADTLSTKVTVRFDVVNRTDERGTRLDIEGARFVERAAWFPSTLALYLGSPAR